MAYTGYIVRKYIDENPNSPTYGETWTEKTLDTTHCPNDGGGWSLVATECELVTSGFTGYRIDTYYNSVTNDYRTERTLDSICHASTNDEIWYNIGDVYCEQNDDGTYTGYGIQEQKQINPNLYNFGIVRKTRVASEECQEHLEPEWQDIQKECNIVQEIGTGTLHYDGTANILQIDINPSSPTFNQTRTINVEDEECEYIPCERMEYEWFYKEESCGSLIPEYYHLENIVPDTVYKIYQMYSKCYVDNVVIRERPENVYSAVTYQEGVTDCLYRWLQTEQTVCEDSYRERWVDSGTTCDNANKYNLQVKEVSEDGGQTWSATTDERLGDLVEANSYDCGYRTRTISGTPYCDYSNHNKYVNTENQVSKDSGATWETTASTITVVEEHSEECGYVDYSREYLTLEAIDSTAFQYLKVSGGTILYSLDSGSTWIENYSTYSDYQHITKTPVIPAGSKVMFKGVGGADNLIYPIDSSGSSNRSARFKVYGNTMSMVHGDNFIGKTNLSGMCFSHTFTNCSGLTEAGNLILPALNLSERRQDNDIYGCYAMMFDNCVSLRTIPELPATGLTRACYYFMFNGCKSLTTLPSNYLSAARTMAERCYHSMFQECSGLTTVNFVLPATTLATECYKQMFDMCRSLRSVPSNMLPNRTLANACYQLMFAGCTSLTQAPELPATTLATYCYRYMFNGSTSLNYIKCLAQNVSTDDTWGWAINVASTGTFIKDANTTWSRGVDGIPSGWAIINT